MKKISEIKFGKAVFDRLIDPDPVTYDQIVRSLGISSKHAQKALSDLCKFGYIMKTDKGYILTQLGQENTRELDG